MIDGTEIACAVWWCVIMKLVTHSGKMCEIETGSLACYFIIACSYVWKIISFYWQPFNSMFHSTSCLMWPADDIFSFC